MKYIVFTLAMFALPALANTGHSGTGNDNQNIGDEQVELDRGDNNGTIQAHNGDSYSTSNTNSNNTHNNGNSHNTTGNDYSDNNSHNVDNSVTNVDKSTTTNGDTHNGDRYVDRSSSATGGAGGQGGKGGKATATGGSVGDTTATVGDTTSESNNVNSNDSVATVGDTVSESNNSNSNDSEGGDVEFNYTNTQADNAASSAASVLTGFCQTGGSAQGFNGGFTLTGNDQFCDRIRMADYYWVQYERQVELAKAFACNQPISALESRCAKIGERMISAIDKAWENTEEANSLLDSGQFASHVEKATGPFARIGGILALLVLL